MSDTGRAAAVGAVVFVVLMMLWPVASVVAVAPHGGMSQGSTSASVSTAAEPVDAMEDVSNSQADPGQPLSTNSAPSSTASSESPFDSGPIRTDKLSPAVRYQLQQSQTSEGDKVPVIVVLKQQPNDVFDLDAMSDSAARQKLATFARDRQSRLLDYLGEAKQTGQAQDIQPYWLRNAVAVKASPETILKITRSYRVKRVIYDQKVEALGESSNTTTDQILDRLRKYGNITTRPEGFERVSSGDRAWSVEFTGADDVQERGITGEGVNVSIVDTGIDNDHPALQGQVVRWKDFTDGNCSTPCDPNGHGTHVAGTVAGKRDAKFAVGTAPGADLFGARALNAKGGGRLSDVLSAFEWSANNSADVVSASLGLSPIVGFSGGSRTAIQPGESSTPTFRVNDSAQSFPGAENLSVSIEGFQPAYVFVVVVPTAENGTAFETAENRSRVMQNLSVALENPDGNRSLKQVEAGWWYSTNEVPDSIGLWKFKPETSRTLQPGNWTINVTNNHPSNVSYDYNTISVYPANGSDEMSRFVNNLATGQDVVPVIAAGNSGFFWGNRSLGSPGSAEEAITVGATGYQTNDIAYFSSRGPVEYGEETRPGVDLIGPGTQVLSTIPANLTYSGDYEDAYAYFSGTSMATPHVSGTIALMLEADGSLNRTEVRNTLRSTAQDVPHGENVVGAGSLDTWAAVNATTDLTARTPRTEAGIHELYAGFTGSSSSYIDIPAEPVRDPAGDAGAAPDLWAASSGAIHEEFELAMHNETPRNGTFDLYIDTDRDDSTGDSNQRGAEYLIRVNRTFSNGVYALTFTEYEYNGSGAYVPTSNVSAGNTDDIQGDFLEFFDITFANRDESDPFEWHIVASTPSTTDTDALPDSGQVTFPGKQNVTAVAVAWNATAGGPDSNQPINMTLYNSSTDAVVANTTVMTDSDGFARASFRVIGIDDYPYDDYRIEIEDRFGNDVRQYVDFEESCIEGCLIDTYQEGSSGPTGDIGNFTVEERRYDVEPNSSVQVNIPIYDRNNDTLTSYTGPASIRIDNSGPDIYRNNLTVEDGVLRFTLDLDNQTFDDSSGRDAWIYVALESDFQNAATATYGAEIDVLSGKWVKTQLAPTVQTTGAQSPAEFTFQNLLQSHSIHDAPANASIEHATLWITDRNVAAFYDDLPESTVETIKELQRATRTPGQPTEGLSDRDRAEIREAQRNLSGTEDVSITFETGNATPDRRGVGTFSVTPPEDARMGFTFAQANATEVNASYSYSTEGVIFVDGRLRQFERKQTQPEEDSRYHLILDGYWDRHREVDFVVPNDTMTVEVALWDSETESFVDNASVRLYATSNDGNVTVVTTSGDGYVTVEVPAPRGIHWPTSEYTQRRQQVVGIAEGFNTADGNAVTDEEFFYGSVWDLRDSDEDTGIAAYPELSYENDTLQATVHYLNQSDWTQANATRTLLKVWKSKATWYESERDVNVSIIDPASDQSSVTFNYSEPFSERMDRVYRAETRTAHQDWPWSDSVYVSGISVQVQSPDSLAAGQTSTVTITLVDRNGDPISDATVVWEYVEGAFSSGGDGGGEESSLSLSHGPSQITGDTAFGTTDADGQVSFDVSAPSLDSEQDVALDLAYRVGFATDNVSVESAQFGAVDVIEEQAVNVTGTVEEPDGTPAASDLVGFDRSGMSVETIPTDSDGNFTYSAIANSTYSVGYYQTDDQNDTFGPVGDGIADVAALDVINSSTGKDIGTHQVPEGHTLDIRVVDQTGDPVENATVDVSVPNGFDHVGLVEIATNANGYLEFGENATQTGIDVNGSVRVDVHPPSGDDRYVHKTYERTVTVSQPKEITVMLQEVSTNVTGQVNEADGEAAENDLIAAFAEEAAPDAVINNFVHTNASGHFDVEVYSGVQTDIQYYQLELAENRSEIPFLKDSSPDIYALQRVNASAQTDIGSITLPKAYNVNVTAVDENGDPVPNATFAVNHHSSNDEADAGLINITANQAGMLDVRNETRGPGLELVGNVSFEIHPPDNAEFVNRTYYRNVTIDTKENFTVTLNQTVTTVSGRILENGSTPAANDSIAIFTEPPSDEAGLHEVGMTNATGHFTQSIMKDEPTDIQYYQAHINNFPSGNGSVPDNETAFPRDGSPDMFALERVNSSEPVDIGTRTLPEAYVVNVTVVDATGDPVKNASVFFEHWGQGGPPTFAGDNPEAGLNFPNGTNANGMFEPYRVDSDGPGLELVGNVSIWVSPPREDPRFVSKTYRRNLTVTGPESVNITLEERANVSILSLEDGETAPGGKTDLNLTLSSAPNGLSGYAVNLTIENDSIASFSGASVPSAFGQSDVNVTMNGSRISISAVDQEENIGAGVTDLLLAAVSVNGTIPGQTDISIEVRLISDNNGSDINPITQEGTLKVTALDQICTEAGCGVPTDPDNDGLFEDMDGNGRFGFHDVVVFFENILEPEVQDHVSAYDFNGNGQIDFDDIVALFKEL